MNKRAPLTRWLIRRGVGEVWIDLDDGDHVVGIGPILPENAKSFALALLEVSLGAPVASKIWGDAGMSTT